MVRPDPRHQQWSASVLGPVLGTVVSLGPLETVLRQPEQQLPGKMLEQFSPFPRNSGGFFLTEKHMRDSLSASSSRSQLLRQAGGVAPPATWRLWDRTRRPQGLQHQEPMGVKTLAGVTGELTRSRKGCWPERPPASVCGLPLSCSSSSRAPSRATCTACDSGLPAPGGTCPGRRPLGVLAGPHALS